MNNIDILRNVAVRFATEIAENFNFSVEDVSFMENFDSNYFDSNYFDVPLDSIVIALRINSDYNGVIVFNTDILYSMITYIERNLLLIILLNFYLKNIVELTNSIKENDNVVIFIYTDIIDEIRGNPEMCNECIDFVCEKFIKKSGDIIGK